MNMTLLVFSGSLWMVSLLFVAFYSLARTSDSKKQRLNSIFRVRSDVLDEELERPFFERVIAPIPDKVLKTLSGILSKRKKGNVKNQTVEKNLKLAGVHMHVQEYHAMRLLLTGGAFGVSLLMAVLASLSAAEAFLLILCALIASVGGPVFVIRRKIAARKESIAQQLPDVLDLLSVSLEAGLGFDAALTKIGDRMHGVLTDELKRVQKEIRMGRPRKEAMLSLVERSPNEELITFLRSVNQAESLGIPIKNILETQARQIRLNRKKIAEEKAMKTPVKILFPLVFFIFPVLFIVLLGPSVLNMLEQFG